MDIPLPFPIGNPIYNLLIIKMNFLKSVKKQSSLLEWLSVNFNGLVYSPSNVCTTDLKVLFICKTACFCF